ncbi:MAG: isoleucine--tRNA ligase [Methanobacteriota archaeon]
MFDEIPPKVSFPALERETLQFWNERGIFAKARKANEGGPRFVFLEGPPTANGVPHVGHAQGRAIKDAYLRYRLMNGFHITPYIAGWDCHGLPVEIEVEKAQGLSSKPEIVEFGVAKFNALCRESVMKYEAMWRAMSERIGFWIDMDHPYVTMDSKYMESVWWSLKELHKKSLLERGHYVVPYCTRCGTPLSSHEVAQGYREVKDLSVTLKFKLAEPHEQIGPNAYVLAWTTTPWTLPGNVALAVGEDIVYAVVQQRSERYVLANELVAKVIQDEYEILGTIKGSEMVGWKYETLFDFMDLRRPGKKAYEIISADFVTTSEGTGVVHTACMYGEDDYKAGTKANLTAVHTVDTEGKFNELVLPWKGRYVKEPGFDLEIAIFLSDSGRLYSKGSHMHTYPFCWRCDAPLLYYALDSWFVRMSRMRERMIHHNGSINWVPEHLKHGRFGNFLDELKDWALSRNRFWGTPLPIWRCPSGHELCVGSFEELGRLAGGLPPDFDPHRSHVDALQIKCPDCGELMDREPYVIDCWYDSGSAFFAQYHYPFENREEFERSFPVDFITEALDQTRGWFYTMLAIGVTVFDKPAYRNVLTQGLMLDENGQKMSKTRGNTYKPEEIFETVGADAARLYLYSFPIWNSVKFSKDLVHEVLRKDINTLWNVYSFFVSNARLDGYLPAEPRLQNELDTWLLSRLSATVTEVRSGFESYELHKSAAAVGDFIDDLSNWYLRRSRRRFWSDTDPEDKAQAYAALYKTLTELAKLMAPFTPFLAEHLYQNLVVKQDSSAPESVHLCKYPTAGPRDEALERDMALAISVAVAGRNARQRVDIKLRQPLQKLTVVCCDADAGSLKKYADILREELNVKEVELATDPAGVCTVRVRPNFKSIGAKFKKDSKLVADEIAKADPALLAGALKAEGKATVGAYEISVEDALVETVDRDGLSGGEWKGLKVYVTTEIKEELLLEGLARELVRRIQVMRKEMDLSYDQRITVALSGDDEIDKAAGAFAEYIKRETLSDELSVGEQEWEPKEWDVDGRKLKLWLKPVV